MRPLHPRISQSQTNHSSGSHSDGALSMNPLALRARCRSLGLVGMLLIVAASRVVLAGPAEVVLALETSLGTEQAINLLRPSVFQEGDLVGVVAFSIGQPQVLLRLSENRDRLATALQRAGIRVGGGFGRVRINDARTADLAGAITLASDQFDRRDAGGQRSRAVIVLFGSPDPNLNTRMQIVRSALESSGARLYAILVDRSSEHRKSPVGALSESTVSPVMTTQLVSELAKHSGGRIYRRNWDLKEILKEVRKK